MNVTRKHRKHSEKQVKEKAESQADQLRKSVYGQIAREGAHTIIDMTEARDERGR